MVEKRMSAKYAGICTACHQRFPAGTEIIYNGRARHVDC